MSRCTIIDIENCETEEPNLTSLMAGMGEGKLNLYQDWTYDLTIER